LSQTYAVESQAFVLHCTAVLTEAGIAMMKTAGSPVMGHPIGGSSAVIGPDGRILSATDTAAEQLIVADLNLRDVVKSKTFADAGGHCKSLMMLCKSMVWLTSRRQPSRHVVARSRVSISSKSGHI
jgi:hypothetical protein